MKRVLVYQRHPFVAQFNKNTYDSTLAHFFEHQNSVLIDMVIVYHAQVEEFHITKILRRGRECQKL